MSSKSKTIATPMSSLRELVNCFDKTLANLDDATEHFSLTVLNRSDIEATVVDDSNKEELQDIMSLLENYVMMSGFLLDHPLLSVMRSIRDKSEVNASDAAMKALGHSITSGQHWQHYKGQIYLITSVAKHANNPLISVIHYQAADDKTSTIWSLPVHEFCRSVTYNDEQVERFKFIN